MSPPDDHLKRLIGGQKQTAKKPKKKQEDAIDLSRLGEMSESELVAVAHMAGYQNASRRLVAEDLAGLILGEIDPPEDPVQGLRQKLESYFQANRTMIRSSAIDQGIDFSTMSHARVIEYYVVNQDIVGA